MEQSNGNHFISGRASFSLCVSGVVRGLKSDDDEVATAGVKTQGSERRAKVKQMKCNESEVLLLLLLIALLNVCTKHQGVGDNTLAWLVKWWELGYDL